MNTLEIRRSPPKQCEDSQVHEGDPDDNVESQLSPARLKNSSNATERRTAAAIAGHLNDVATARQLLDDEDPDVRATALGALNRLQNLTEAELLSGLRDQHTLVLRRALRESVHWQGDIDTPITNTIAQQITELLNHPDPLVVEAAAWASGERPTLDSTIDRLMQLVEHHEDALVRESAVAALGAIGNERALPVILLATNDRATVRRRAIIALAPFSGDDVDAALQKALSDRDWQVRQAAEDLLAE